MPGSLSAWWLSLSFLLVPLSLLLLWTCPALLFRLFPAGILPVPCQRLGISSVQGLWLCPAFCWLNQLRLGLLVLEQGDGQQSLQKLQRNNIQQINKGAYWLISLGVDLSAEVSSKNTFVSVGVNLYRMKCWNMAENELLLVGKY